MLSSCHSTKSYGEHSKRQNTKTVEHDRLHEASKSLKVNGMHLEI